MISSDLGLSIRFDLDLNTIVRASPMPRVVVEEVEEDERGEEVVEVVGGMDVEVGAEEDGMGEEVVEDGMICSSLARPEEGK